ncbi:MULTISPECIES: Fe-S cluster domain-containing protein [environmental samples]|mgnify:CR=1 FL=1|uniref:Fe-S cluster domain-containing protein n=1 Tax=environmental samples TaxID=134245 RepID=UPI00033CA819|nr:MULTISPECIES: Fe-S cluster domain-containing protein [environmental samples]CCY11315.1 putative electron transport complex RnfABCDGE type B subunit [Porphyromonas sp. CAG:1061]
MIVTILFLAIVGALAALLLFVVSKKFHVEEDARIELVNEALPGANCGGCGYPGCSGFARACVEAESMEGLFCTVGGNDTMLKVADILGRTAVEAEPQLAVVRCNGTCDARPKVNQYDGASSCAIAAATYGGETGCTFGCLGLGDCTLACGFDAIKMNPLTGLPEVDEERCTACGACVKACPKMIIELRKKGPKGRRVFVSCVNKEKGGVAKKACDNACIGCSKCFKECKFEAITIANNLAYIDPNKCRLCRKCVEACPTGAIHEINFPPRKPKAEPVVETAEA